MHLSQSRKRVNAVLRAPDGSAFKKCEICGVSVAFALYDMHECEKKRDVKRFKGESSKSLISIEHKYQDQPRSEFRFFMESFVKNFKDEKEIDVDNKGFEMWKNMSEEERLPYVLLAKKVNSAYTRKLFAEVNKFSRADDEADSAEVGKYDQMYNCDDDYYNESECFESSSEFCVKDEQYF